MNDHVDTGFGAIAAGAPIWKAPEEPAAGITVAVNEEISPPNLVTPEPPGLTPDGVEAAKSLVRMPQKTFVELASLARDVAMDIKEHHVILKDHGLDQGQYDWLEAHHDFYKQALRSAITDWHAPLSTQERIKIEAAAILEDSLIGLGARMQSKTEGLPGVIEAAKLFAKVAGVGEREVGVSNPGERFTINIDLGGDTKIVVGGGGAAAVPVGPNPMRAVPANGEA